MARYVPQRDEALPTEGANNITHHIKIIESNTAVDLELDVNMFFASLEVVAAFPIIKKIDYHPLPPKPQAFIHYVLVV